MFASKIYKKMGTLDPFKNKSIHTKFVCKYDVCKKKPECLEKNIKQLIGTTLFADNKYIKPTFFLKIYICNR